MAFVFDRLVCFSVSYDPSHALSPPLLRLFQEHPQSGFALRSLQRLQNTSLDTVKASNRPPLNSKPRISKAVE